MTALSLDRSFKLDLTDARAAGAGMLATGLVAPYLPMSSGILCPLRRFTGIPCPLCGMTTSVVATLDLRFDDALISAPAGILLVGLALGLLVYRTASFVQMPAWLPVLVLTLMWSFQLARIVFA